MVMEFNWKKFGVVDEYTLDILCLMVLADAFGFEYGEFTGGRIDHRA